MLAHGFVSLVAYVTVAMMGGGGGGGGRGWGRDSASMERRGKGTPFSPPHVLENPGTPATQANIR